MSAKAKTIIYVHGIGNKPAEDVLKCQWDQALFGFELGERSRLSYWVNREFYPDPSPVTCRDEDKTRVGEESGDIGARGLAIQDPEAALDEVVSSLAQNNEEKRVLERLKKELDRNADIKEASVSAAGVEQKILPLPAPIRRWLTRHVTSALLRDVHEYFFVPARRDIMKNSLLDRIRVGGGPFVVIAHSQGSMIAYDVLEELSAREADVALFITIGSPLGLTEVQDQLKKLKNVKALKIPACVKRWLNVADPFDPVCLDKTLANEFRPKKSITDKLRWNRNSPRDPHSGSGYLELDVVREAVQQAVEISLFQPVADFTVARDLVREIETQPDRRHPVLVQLAVPKRNAFLDLKGESEKIIDWLVKESDQDEETLQIERLRHYVGAHLTRREIELLASNYAADHLKVHRLWKDAEKFALLTQSINTVQARPAHLGYGADGKDIRWAVLDSGIAADHPHFERYGNIVAQFDCTKLGALEEGPATDGNGHGTHVAGIIAGILDAEENGKQTDTYSGMAPAAQLVVYKVLNDAGRGRDAWILKALDHIAGCNEKAGEPVIQGVNLSLGGGFDPSVFGCGHTPLCVELRRLWNQGVAVVIAAGNEGFAVLMGAHGDIDANLDLSIGDPANLDDAIAVGSVNKSRPHTYGISYFSSRGPTADGRQKPDLVAPGERILSCRHDFTAGSLAPADLYVERSGTSMAAPHVSGILASFLSSKREFIGFPTKSKHILLKHCTDLNRDPMHQGAGLPNLVKMLMNT